MPLENTMIHLIGSPGAGKYTIARALVAKTGARLIDNHSIANVIFNVLNVDGITPLPPSVWVRVGRVRAAVFDAITNLSPPAMSFVFTNYIRGDDPADVAVFEEFLALAAKRGAAYVPVLLSCETPELLRRIVQPDRAARMKLIDPVEGARINDEIPPFETDHANVLRLDVTALAPDAAAATTIAWAERCAAAQ